MNFDRKNNWEDIPGLKDKEVPWEETQDTRYPYRAKVDEQDWRIRMNNFPDEPLYTLIIDRREIIHFNEPPSGWRIEY